MLETELVPAPRSDSRRLMVVLHGLGDSIEGYRWLPSALGLPWMNYLLVNAPDPYYGGYAWYDFTGDAWTGIQMSHALLVDLLTRQQEVGYPAEETTLFGFSQGCLMALEVGFCSPCRLAGIVGISGYVHQPGRLLDDLALTARQQRVLITHGTLDPLIPFQGVKGQVRQLQEAGLNIAWHEFAKVHTIAGDEELGVIRNFVCAGYPNR